MSRPTCLVLSEAGVIAEDLHAFLTSPPEDFKGKQYVVASIDWNYYGMDLHSINSISASFLKFDEEGQLDLPALIVASTKSDLLLPAQKLAIRDWILDYIKKKTGDILVWKRTYAHVKQFIR